MPIFSRHSANNGNTSPMAPKQSTWKLNRKTFFDTMKRRRNSGSLAVNSKARPPTHPTISPHSSTSSGSHLDSPTANEPPIPPLDHMVMQVGSINDVYRMQDGPIGEGAFAVVYKARHVTDVEHAADHDDLVAEPHKRHHMHRDSLDEVYELLQSVAQDTSAPANEQVLAVGALGDTDLPGSDRCGSTIDTVPDGVYQELQHAEIRPRSVVTVHHDALGSALNRLSLEDEEEETKGQSDDCVSRDSGDSLRDVRLLDHVRAAVGEENGWHVDDSPRDDSNNSGQDEVGSEREDDHSDLGCDVRDQDGAFVRDVASNPDLDAASDHGMDAPNNSGMDASNNPDLDTPNNPDLDTPNNPDLDTSNNPDLANPTTPPANHVTYYAVKKFVLDEIEDDSKRTRALVAVENEARMLSIIHNTFPDDSNVIKFYGLHAEQSTGNMYLGMEYMAGGELFDRITEREYFTEQDAVGIFRKAANGVFQIHSCGVVHRDLKPENILFADSGEDAQVKVADFGTAYLLGEEDMDVHKDTRIGSPGYFAPEVYRCTYGPAGDVWSMGVILYCLLSGYHPFPGDTETDIMLNVITGQFEFDLDVWDDISHEAKDLISKMLVLDPTKRCTMADVLNHPWLSDEFDPHQRSSTFKARVPVSLKGTMKRLAKMKRSQRLSLKHTTKNVRRRMSAILGRDVAVAFNHGSNRKTSRRRGSTHAM